MALLIKMTTQIRSVLIRVFFQIGVIDFQLRIGEMARVQPVSKMLRQQSGIVYPLLLVFMINKSVVHENLTSPTTLTAIH